MSNDIGRDGDLGDLGRDRLGDARTGIDEAQVDAFFAALQRFNVACAKVREAENDARQAVTLLEGWVTVGQQALDILRPLIARWTAGNVETAGGDAQGRNVLTRLTDMLQQAHTMQTSLTGLFPGPTGV